MKRVVVLISGQGRNLQALMEACADGGIPARIVAVISNKPDAPGLARARGAGIATRVIPHAGYSSREDFDAALAQEIDLHRPDMILLAGFMRVLTDGFVRRYRGRLLNIHPSLLPKYPGLNTHRRALEAGDREHGATVHFVTEALDGGPAIIQGQFSVLPQDTADSLAQRVMNEIETRIYPLAAAWMARGELNLENDRVLLRGAVLGAPLRLSELPDDL